MLRMIRGNMRREHGRAMNCHWRVRVTRGWRWVARRKSHRREAGKHVRMIIGPWWRMGGILPRPERTVRRSKLKSLSIFLGRRIYFNAFSSEDVVQIIQIEVGYVTP